jgi:riboflavin kinase/FMN adenylyltransferase
MVENMIEGIVVRGKGEAGKIYGIPTANLVLDSDLDKGVYMGLARILPEKNLRKALICIGARDNLLELHLLDFDGDLYGKLVKVDIGDKIRDLIPFESVEQMKSIMSSDLAVAKSKHDL